MSKQEKIIYLLFPFLIFLPFLFWLRRYLNIDFWYDEVFTLTNYVFCPIAKTLSDYSFPNNHIFANLLNNLYLRILGIKDIYQLLATPYKIRLLELFYTGVGLFYLYRIGKEFFDENVAFLSLSVLTTTVTYYNFVLQVRGFSLSLMLVTILLFYILKYIEAPRPLSALIIILSTAFLLYAIPSNLYLLLGVFGYYFLSLLRGKREKRKKREERVKISSWERRNQISLLFLLFLGILLSGLFYSPVLRDVVSNRFVRSYGLFYLPTLFSSLPFTLAHFFSARYLFLPLIIIGLFSYGRKKERMSLGFLFSLLLLPFIFSFVRGDRPYLRIFVILTPIFALSISVLLVGALHFISGHFRRKEVFPFLLLGIILYNQITFAFQIREIERRLARDIEEGVQSQDLNYNYYQAHYQPLCLLREFKEIYDAKPQKVFLVEYDRAALPVYLEKFAIPWEQFTSLEQLRKEVLERGGCYVITALPNNFLRILSYLSEFEVKKINSGLDFHRIFEIKKRQ
jgi:hypothetical protein